VRPSGSEAWVMRRSSMAGCDEIDALHAHRSQTHRAITSQGA
jgi:hypothetical protein